VCGPSLRGPHKPAAGKGRAAVNHTPGPSACWLLPAGGSNQLTKLPTRRAWAETGEPARRGTQIFFDPATQGIPVTSHARGEHPVNFGDSTYARHVEPRRVPRWKVGESFRARFRNSCRIEYIKIMDFAFFICFPK
jgi:hypothetical protein